MSTSRSSRWLAPWRASATKPAIYHCISRVVDRRFVLGEEERDHFRRLMRIYEGFTGCRVLTYCIMSNHFHLLLEVPPMPEDGISDDEFCRRLACVYDPAWVDHIRTRLAAARACGDDLDAAAIRSRYLYRMHDLSQFMKTLLQRFTRWFNLRHNRRGHLWEERFRSVIVESGLAARTVAAYIDLNPVRAGIVADPAAYRWSGYGEAAGIATRRNGQAASQLARAALARVCELCRADFSDPAAGHPDHPPDPSRLPPIHPDTWKSTSRDYRRAMGLALERKPGLTTATRGPSRESPSPHDSSQKSPRPVVEDEPDSQIAAMLRHRVRYFSDGAVIGGRDFVDQTFAAAPERFGPHRKTGARKLKGKAALAAKCLWSVRDLRPDPPTE